MCAAGKEERVLVQAAVLATSLGLEVANADAGYDILLIVTSKGLELREGGQRRAGPVKVDFVSAAKRHLRKRSGLLKQPLARAVGVRGIRPVVWDATAGLGRDAWLLACMGCKVIAVERSPILWAMLQDALVRAARVKELRPIVDNLELIVADARQLLAAVSPGEAPDVVYLDPMFSAKKKSALPKKEMRVLRRLVGDDADAGELLEAALRVALRRVVVKRLRHAFPLRPHPDINYQGKIARYDVYLARRSC